MHLVNVKTLRLEKFLDGHVPPYAILSHTWGPDKEEVSFEDIQNGNLPESSDGVEKLKGCCAQAMKDHLEYAWIDTCCINKQSSRELEEAINSMFKWYQKASICYTYLSDVANGNHRHPGSKFFSSRWFQRGWTLQELLAARTVRFYNQEWRYIGTKADLAGPIEAITGIPRSFFLGWEDLQQASIAQRMSWAAKRRTTRREDTAYCLLGIFNVTMSMIYGEGDYAMRRLQEEIMKKTGDHSILAWGLGESSAQQSADALSAGVLAAAPSDFAYCRHIVPRRSEAMSTDGFRISGGHLSIHLSLHTTAAGETFGLLQCGPQDNTDRVVGIPLQEVNPGAAQDDYFRPQDHYPILLSRSDISVPSTTKQIHIQMERQNRVHEAPGQRFWLHIEGHEEVDLKLKEHYPVIAWEDGRAVIATVGESDSSTIRQQIIRFRPVYGEPKDIAVVLEFDSQGLTPEPRLHVVVFDRDFSLKLLSETLTHMRPEGLGKSVAKIGNFRVEASVEIQPVAHEPVFFLKLASAPALRVVPENVDNELSVATLKQKFSFILQEHDKLGQRMARLADQGNREVATLCQIRERQAIVEAQLRKLEEEKKSLAYQEEEAVQDVDLLTEGFEAALKQLRRRLVGVPDLRERLDKTDISRGPGNWLEALFNKLRNAGDITGSSMAEEDSGRSQFLGTPEGGHNTNDWSPLVWAASYGHETITKLLLEKGADTEAEDDEGNTPLLWAARRGDEAIAKLLLEKGADPEAKDDDGYTPLLWAAQRGYEAVTKLLLENGADIEAKDSNGDTPLSFAAANGREAVVRVLIDHRANIEVENRYGWTPAFLAAKFDHNAALLLIFQNAGADSAYKMARELPPFYQLPRELRYLARPASATEHSASSVDSSDFFFDEPPEIHSNRLFELP